MITRYAHVYIFKRAFFFVDMDSGIEIAQGYGNRSETGSIVERFRAIIADLRNGTISIVDGEAQ